MERIQKIWMKKLGLTVMEMKLLKWASTRLILVELQKLKLIDTWILTYLIYFTAEI